MRTFGLRALAAPALMVAVAGFGFGAVPVRAAEAPLGGETPEAVVERLRAAAVAEDFRELGACMAPEARKELAIGIYLGSTMMIGMAQAMGGMGADMGAGMAEGLGADDKEAKKQAEKAKKELEAKFAPWEKRYNTLAKKHGLPALGAEDKGFDPEAAFAKVDSLALLADFGALLKAFGKESGESSPKPPAPTGKLKGLKIEGDRASGEIDSEPITFVKLDGRWYIAEVPKKKEAPEGN